MDSSPTEIIGTPEPVKTFTIRIASKRYFRAQDNNQQVFFQRLFSAEPGKTVEFALGGAFGGGKSKCVAAAAVGIALRWPGSRILIGRKDLGDLKDTLYRDFGQICPPQVIRAPRTPLATRETMASDVVLHNGSRIMFRELKDMGGKLSLEINAFIIEQGEEVEFDVFRLLTSRLRPWPGCPSSPFFAVTTFNPYNGWGKDRYVKPPKGQKVPPNAFFIKLSPLENTDLLSAKADYIEDLRSKFPSSWMERFIEGNWDVPVSGAIFPEFHTDRHVLQAFRNNYAWKRVCIVDPHFAKPFSALWCAFVPGGPLVAYDELVGNPDQPTSEFLEQIKVVTKTHRAMSTDILLDYSLAGVLHKKNQGKSLKKLLVEADLSWRPVFKGAKLDQILRMKNALVPGKTLPPEVYITANCVNLIDQLMRYQWKESGNSKIEPKKVDDDLIDCIMYAQSERDRIEPESRSDVRRQAFEATQTGEADVRIPLRVRRPGTDFDEERRRRNLPVSTMKTSRTDPFNRIAELARRLAGA